MCRDIGKRFGVAGRVELIGPMFCQLSRIMNIEPDPLP
jgi:hypothetical protein